MALQPTVYLAFNDSEGKLTSAVAYEEHTGEVLETVDFLEDGTPDWRGGGICDPRGTSLEAFNALITALDAAEANAKEIGYEVRRVPEDPS